MTTRIAAVPQSEGDTNLTGRRAAWQGRALDEKTRALLAEDERYFLRQSVSTPCLNAIAKAEGIWIEDVAGRRYMDFHGNNVHHIGYGHPRLKKAIAEQMEALPFAPRRYANAPAVALAAKLSDISPFGPAKVLFTTGGSDAIEVAVKIARAATGRFKTLSFWDAFHGAGVGAGALSGEALFRSGPAAPLVAGAVHVAPFGSTRCPYGTASAQASGEACARMIEYVLEREGDIAALSPSRSAPCPTCRRPASGRVCAPPATGTARCWCSTRFRPGSARRGRCSPASTTAWRPTFSCSARRWAAASCRSRRCWRGRSSTWAPSGRSATTRTRRTR